MVRHWAANALVDLGDPRAYQASIDLLGDSQPVVRANAAFTLGRLGNPCALPRLLAVRPRPWRAPLQWLAFRRVYRGAIGALRRRAAGKEPRAWSDARWFKGFRNAVFFLALAGVCVALGASADFWWGLLPLALVLLSWTVTAVMWMRGWH
jgi:cytochrome c biogenesis protein CcdA